VVFGIGVAPGATGMPKTTRPRRAEKLLLAAASSATARQTLRFLE
jgi:hypothetical protein